MSIARVLAVPHGQKRDTDGRAIGDDWLLADCGCAEDGTHYYVTTDRVRCSEMCDYRLDPLEVATALAAALNAQADAVDAAGRVR